MLPIAVTDEQGDIVHCRTRFSLIKKEDGSVDVIFYPKLTQSNLDRFGEENQQKLQTGIRTCMGDEQKWKEQNQKEWGKYNFGCFGCWMMDEEGNLDYIPEEEYSDELWEELKKTRYTTDAVNPQNVRKWKEKLFTPKTH